MNFLTEREKEQLRLQHKRERDKRICDRIKAILLYDEGWTPQQIAKVLLITDQAVRNHIVDYETAGKLKPEGGGSEEKLSKQQSEKLEAHLREHIYLYIKLDFVDFFAKFIAKGTINERKNQKSARTSLGDAVKNCTKSRSRTS